MSCLAPRFFDHESQNKRFLEITALQPGSDRDHQRAYHNGIKSDIAGHVGA
jgi:hypothetical protein